MVRDLFITRNGLRELVNLGVKVGSVFIACIRSPGIIVTCKSQNRMYEKTYAAASSCAYQSPALS